MSLPGPIAPSTSEISIACANLCKTIIDAFYKPKERIIFKGFLLFDQSRVSENELADRLHLNVKEVREVLAKFKSDGLLERQAEEKKKVEEANPGAPEPKRYGAEKKDSLWYIDEERICKKIKFRLLQMQDMLQPKGSTRQDYECPNSKCLSRGPPVKTWDLFELVKLSGAQEFVCTFCATPLKETEETQMEWGSKGEEMRVKVNMAVGRIIEQIRLIQSLRQEETQTEEEKAARASRGGSHSGRGSRQQTFAGIEANAAELRVEVGEAFTNVKKEAPKASLAHLDRSAKVSRDAELAKAEAEKERERERQQREAAEAKEREEREFQKLLKRKHAELESTDNSPVVFDEAAGATANGEAADDQNFEQAMQEMDAEMEDVQLEFQDGGTIMASEITASSQFEALTSESYVRYNEWLEATGRPPPTD